MFDCGAMEPPHIGATLTALAERTPPGPAAVSVLAGIDPAGLTGAQLVDLLKAVERQAAWLAAYQVQVLAAMDGGSSAAGAPAGQLTGEELVRVEVAAALRISEPTAYKRLAAARALTSRLPGTLSLLTGGAITYWHALRVVEATAPLTDDQAAAVEARVLPKATGQTLGELGRALRRAVICAGPAAAQATHDAAVADRTVDMWALPDGMALLRTVGPAADVTAVYTALTALADRPVDDDDDRLAGARRFDALTEVCARMLTAGTDPGGAALPTRHGQKPHIQVTVAATTMLGLDEQPGELAGYGPITAQVARRIAADGTWRRILHDPADGRLLHYGRTTYAPPADLTRHIIARDRTCTFPHCTRAAWRCDIDHAVPWDEGGYTDPDNCGALCRRHHRAKTTGCWALKRDGAGTCTWTSPAGRTYLTHPPPYGDHP